MQLEVLHPLGRGGLGQVDLVQLPAGAAGGERRLAALKRVRDDRADGWHVSRDVAAEVWGYCAGRHERALPFLGVATCGGRAVGTLAAPCHGDVSRMFRSVDLLVGLWWL